MERDRGSRTAERVAERRAAHQLLDRPLVFEDPLALRIVAGPPPDDDHPVARALRAFLVARSRFAEDEFAASGASQYVLIGAGYDTFAYRNPRRDLRVFEVDHPATQLAKKQRLAEAAIAIPENLTFIAADLAVTPLRDALAGGGFDPKAPAFFAWLGVVPYLEQRDIEATLAYVGSLPGATIVLDYGIPRHQLGLIGRIIHDRMARRVAAAGEPWESFFTPDEMRALLTRTGFGTIADLGEAEINERYFARRTDKLRVGSAGRLVRATAPA